AQRLGHGAGDLVFGELFAGDVGEVGAFAEELDQRRMVVKAGAADDVVDVVAVEAIGRRRQDEIGTAFLQLVGRQDGRLRRVDLFLGDELEVVGGDVEDAAGRGVAYGNGHAP